MASLYAYQRASSFALYCWVPSNTRTLLLVLQENVIRRKTKVVFLLGGSNCTSKLFCFSYTRSCLIIVTAEFTGQVLGQKALKMKVPARLILVHLSPRLEGSHGKLGNTPASEQPKFKTGGMDYSDWLVLCAGLQRGAVRVAPEWPSGWRQRFEWLVERAIQRGTCSNNCNRH